jgi:predicted kinase
VAALTGPRQAGKSVLAKQVFPNKTYCLLSDVQQNGYIIYAGGANQTRENIKILSWESLDYPGFIES